MNRRAESQPLVRSLMMTETHASPPPGAFTPQTLGARAQAVFWRLEHEERRLCCPCLESPSIF